MVAIDLNSRKLFEIGDERSPDAGRWVLGLFVSFANTIAGGSSEIQRNIIAQRVLGLPRA